VTALEQVYEYVASQGNLSDPATLEDLLNVVGALIADREEEEKKLTKET